MTRQVLPYNSLAKRPPLVPQPASAWLAITGLIAFTALCLLVHIDIIRVAFPLGSFAVGVLLYRRYPILYLGFTWWLWLLTPWVRRLIDYQNGWVNPNPVLLAPYLVTLITLTTLLRYLPKVYRHDSIPYVLSFMGVVYGLLIGLVNSKFEASSKMLLLHSIIGGVTESSSFSYTVMGVIIDALDWITPIIFGFHLFINWQQYPEYKQNIQRTFCWGVLVTGAYGVVQYLIAPEWDRFWLINAIELGGTSFGSPEPLGIRVFSTMNAPGPFAAFMWAGLLLLLAGKGILSFLTSTVGYLAFLLTLARAAWGGWFLGLLIFGLSLKQRTQMRLIITLLIIGICAFSLTTVEPFSEAINTRVQTLSDVQEDGSFQARSEIYQRALGVALSEVLGNGFGVSRMDSALIDTLVAMGWIGGILYFSGMILLASRLFQSTKKCFDPFISAASAISLSTLTMLCIGNPLIEVSGVILWSFGGIALAGHKYYEHKRTMGLERN